VKNFEFLFGAWVTVWIVFLLYDISLAHRVGRLRDEIKRLSERISGNE
jgi:hypothetical protein